MGLSMNNALRPQSVTELIQNWGVSLETQDIFKGNCKYAYT